MPEITKEMIEAGVEAFCKTNYEMDSFDEIVTEIYQAMEAVKPEPFKVSRETVIKISKEVSEKIMENNKIFQKLRGSKYG